MLDGVLVRSSATTRAPGALTSGNRPATSTHSCRGFVETRQERRPGGTSPASNAVVSILGASVSPAMEPAVNDQVTFDGVRYRLLELLERDPAAALYVFRAERG